MKFEEHAIIGLGTAGLSPIIQAMRGIQSDSSTLLTGALSIVLGAAIADLDHSQSFISRSIPRKLLFPAMLLLLVGLVFTAFSGTRIENSKIVEMGTTLLTVALGPFLVSKILSRTLKHRGPWHSLAVAGGATLVGCFLCWQFNKPLWVGLCFGWGWVSHVLADSTTHQGVPLWWPFYSRRVRIGTHATWIGKTWLLMSAVLGIIAVLLSV
ncbi:MAG: metal-dependent hydrolase [Anaerolineae bacterium]|nr:metal-dependent hydrolase [Anaerolineae bacterium]